MADKKLQEAILAVCKKYDHAVEETAFAKDLPHTKVEERAAAINALLQAHRLQVFVTSAGATTYRAAATEHAARMRGLDAEHMLVYQTIGGVGAHGIWTRDMKARTNLPQPRINRILKALEERGLVKAVKSVQSASRKVYMLAGLEPARELTGGPWYGPDSLDSHFIETLQDICLRYLRAHGPAPLAAVAAYIAETGISKDPLGDEDVHRILKSLEYDVRVEEVLAHGTPAYRLSRARLPPRTALTGMPCGGCPAFDECVEGGRVSPEACVYFDDWLAPAPPAAAPPAAAAAEPMAVDA